MQGMSDAFAAAVTNPVSPDRREMVAEHLESLARLVRTHGVVDGSLTTGPFVVDGGVPAERGRMDYKVHLVIDLPQSRNV
jgi:hypothetical protein